MTQHEVVCRDALAATPAAGAAAVLAGLQLASAATAAAAVPVLGWLKQGTLDEPHPAAAGAAVGGSVGLTGRRGSGTSGRADPRRG